MVGRTIGVRDGAARVRARRLGFWASTLPLFVGAVLLLCPSASAQGESITLGWNPSVSLGVVGYDIFYGGASGTYTNMISAGDVTNAIVSGLLAGSEYFFAVAAVNGEGELSALSTETSYVVPASGLQLTVTVNSQSRPYGTANPALTGTVTGLQSGSSVTVTYSTVATPASPVGTYSIVPVFSDPDNELPNYATVIVNGTLTVTPAALTISAANVSKLYGAALPALTATCSGLASGDTPSSLTTQPTLTTTATAASPVGSYPITVSGAADPNYTITYVNGTLTVNPAGLTVTAANASKLYSAALPALTLTYSGFVNGDTASSLTAPATVATTATASSPVGAYPITPGGAADPNYAMIYVNGTLTVSKAPLTITAANASKVYGAALPAFTATYSGFVNGDTASSLTTQPSFSTTATASSAVGNYSLTVRGAADPNYTISYVSGTLTVSPAPLTITAANVSKLYGAALPALTATYSGFVNGDTASKLTTRPTLTTTATASSPVGSYPITASGAADPNYTLSYVSGTLTVNPAALTVTAANASMVYGSALPALKLTYSGLVNGDTVSSLTTPGTAATTATASSPAGSYPITASGAADSNYTINYVNGTLTVSKAPLTITAANASKVYGAPLPAFTATYSGFVNGDTVSSLTTAPTLTTSATASSAVGSYSITASGAVDPNYTFTYVSGTLVVSKAGTAGVLSSSANPSESGQAVKFTLSLSAVAPGAGTPTGTAQFAVDGAAAGAPVSLSGGAGSYATSTLKEGSHTISGQYAGSANFLGTTNQLSQSVQ